MAARYGLTLAIAALAIFSAGGCTRRPIEADMAMLDRAYIPALALSSDGNREGSVLALEVLRLEWTRFRQRHYRGKPDDALWNTDLDDVDRRIGRAEALVLADNLDAAHEELEGIRRGLLELRRRNGIDYFPDRLTEFHDPMEAIYLTAQERGPAGMDSSTMAALRLLAANARSAWDKASVARLDGRKLRLDRAAINRATELIAAQTRALDVLDAALAGGDAQAVHKAGLAVRPPFARLYMLFGDFAGPGLPVPER
jgi:hypothetical protein